MYPYVYAVQISVPAEKEARFNEIYDGEHVAAITALPGVGSCTRYKLEWSTQDDMPDYLALYEVDDPELPRSAAWRAAADVGAWPTEIRPFLIERRHTVFRRLPGAGS